MSSGEPVDIMGISTGGPIAQHFAADHPDLVRRLVLAMTGYRLSEEGKKLQRRLGDLPRQGKWRKAYSTMIDGMYPRGIKKHLFKLLMWLFGTFAAPGDARARALQLNSAILQTKYVKEYDIR